MKFRMHFYELFLSYINFKYRVRNQFIKWTVNSFLVVVKENTTTSCSLRSGIPIDLYKSYRFLITKSCRKLTQTWNIKNFALQSTNFGIGVIPDYTAEVDC